jgi:plastocyanin
MGYVLRAAALGALLLTSVLFLAGCHGEPRGEAARGGKEAPAAHGEPKGAPQTDEPNQIVIDNFTFRPRSLTVAAGTRVTWVNRDDVPHTATSSGKPRAFDSGTLDTDDRFAHVFATPGTYDYFCAVHPHMTGRVIVK